MSFLRASVSPSLVIACLVLSTAATASAQTSRIESGSALVGGIAFYYETRLEPPTPPLGDALSMLVFTTAPNIVHRVMLDRSQKVYFGYDVRIDHGGLGPLPGGQLEQPTYVLTFGPLTDTSELMRTLGGDAGSWKRLPTPRFPEARGILSGEVIELALLTNDAWGQKLTEYVTVGQAPATGFNAGRRREFSFPPGSPRDFSAADVILTLTEPIVRWTSQLNQGGQRGGSLQSRTVGDVSGVIVWVYVPTAGRFLLSLTPRGQFVRAGTVRGTELTFRIAGNTYTVNSATRIVPADAAFNLYVLHQPGWKPTYEHANLDVAQAGAADKAEYLVEPVGSGR